MGEISGRVVRCLEKAEIGRIVFCNIVFGVENGLLTREEVLEFLTIWSDWVEANDYEGEESDSLVENEVLGCLGALVVLSADASVFHIACKRPVEVSDTGSRASVRGIHTLQYFVDPEDLSGIRPFIAMRARPGTVAYDTALRHAAALGKVKVNLSSDDKASMTRRDLGERAVFWYTKADELIARLDATTAEERADVARDVLGLIHLNRNSNVAVVTMPHEMVDARADTGRPTFVDAGTHSRFKGMRAHEELAPTWGEAADLSKITSGTDFAAGLSERVCGRVPSSNDTDTDGRILGLYFLFSPKVPRGDEDGKLNDSYVALLQRQTVEKEFGVNPSDLEKYLSV